IARILGVPSEIINKKPSAGLWEGQTDEKDLGITYKLLDEILYRLVDLKMKKENIARGLNIPLKKVEYVESLIKKGEHKRKLPFGPEI
ncbi:NAD(+) synthase, partial [Thermococci archaeon]